MVHVGMIRNGQHSLFRGRLTQTPYLRQDVKVLLLEGVDVSTVKSFQRACYSHVELHATGLPQAKLKARIP